MFIAFGDFNPIAAMLSAAELARLCRICLRQLKDPQKPNSRLICLLKKFLDIDILHQDAGFPTDICNLCHNAVAYFEELCQVARETGEKLCEQLKDSQDYPRVDICGISQFYANI